MLLCEFPNTPLGWWFSLTLLVVRYGLTPFHQKSPPLSAFSLNGFAGRSSPWSLQLCLPAICKRCSLAPPPESIQFQADIPAPALEKPFLRLHYLEYQE